MLKAKEGLVTECILGLRFLDDDDILDPDSKLAIFVIPRLIREHIPGAERDLGVLNARPDAYWPFMDIEVRSHTVTGAVSVVYAIRLCYVSETDRQRRFPHLADARQVSPRDAA